MTLIKRITKRLFCKHIWHIYLGTFTEPSYWYKCVKCGKVYKP